MKKTLKIYILLIILFAVQLFVLSKWLGCVNFTSSMHFSLFDLQLRIIENIHNDKDMPLRLVRIFHNKVVGSVFDVFAQYLQFWNVLFLSSFLSLSGIVGLGAGLYAFFRKKKSWILWLLFGYLMLVPFVEILAWEKFPYLFRLILIAAAFLFWSMYGYWYLLKEKKVNSKIIDALIILSLWYAFAVPTVSLFCTLK